MATSTPLPSIRRNYLFGGLQALVGAAFPLVMLSYAARILGPESLGKYYFANSLVSYFILVAGLGIPIYGTREIGKARGNPEQLRQSFRELFAINLGASLIAWIAYLVVIIAVPQFRAEGLLFGIVGLLLLNNGLNLDYLYAGQERQDFLAYRSLASRVISLVLLVVLVREPDDYHRLAAIAVIAGVFNTALSLKGLRQLGGGTRRLTLNLRRHVRPLAYLVASLVFVNLYVVFDSVLLGLITSAHEVGFFNVSIRPSRTFALLMTAVTASITPRLALLLTNDDKEAHGSLQRKSFEMLFFAVVPVAFTLAVSSGPIVSLLFGDTYREASLAMALSAPLVLVNSLTVFVGFQILLPAHKERGMMYVALCAASVGILLNLTLAPMWGHRGAVAAALGAETACLLAQLLLVRKMGPGHLALTGAVWRYVAAGGAMGLTQWMLLSGGANTAASSLAAWAVSGIVYVAMLAVMKDPLVLAGVRAALLRRGAA